MEEGGRRIASIGFSVGANWRETEEEGFHLLPFNRTGEDKRAQDRREKVCVGEGGGEKQKISDMRKGKAWYELDLEIRNFGIHLAWMKKHGKLDFIGSRRNERRVSIYRMSRFSLGLRTWTRQKGLD